MSKGAKETHGTEITLYLNEDSYEFSNEYRAREVLQKYCAFMPVEICQAKEGGEPEYQNVKEDELRPTDKIEEYFTEPAKTEEKENEDGTKETVEIVPEQKMVKIRRRPFLINDTHPLWAKHPNECTCLLYTSDAADD